jgi:hypothetical protein
MEIRSEILELYADRKTDMHVAIRKGRYFCNFELTMCQKYEISKYISIISATRSDGHAFEVLVNEHY